MPRPGFFRLPSLLFLIALYPAHAQAPTQLDAQALVEKIQAELSDSFIPPESNPDPALPHGEILEGLITDSKIYPGTENRFQVYIPAQYDPAKPACLLVKLDGLSEFEATVLDNLIAHQEVPVIIAVGIVPGTIWKDPAGTPNRRALRFNRSYEFDSTNDNFSNYVLDELLPAVEHRKTANGRPLRLSRAGNDHAATGGSTGGIGSFTLAWQRPDQFQRVYSVIGTFVSMRGGNEYPILIRKTDPKPIRIFLEDGSADAWNPLFGSWFDANLNMESALTFAGYDVAHAWGTHGHDGRPGRGIFPDVMRWLWHDYPAAIKSGVSKNSTLQEISLPAEPWRKISPSFESAAGLSANAQGDVYLTDASARAIYRLSNDSAASIFWRGKAAIGSASFGPDGTLYGLVSSEKKVVSIDARGNLRTVAEGVSGNGIIVTHTGKIYVTELSRILEVDARENKVVDDGLLSPSGLTFSPDGSLFFAAEKTSQWIYSYVVQPNGSFTDKQRFYWLHSTDIPNNSGAEDLAVDTHGNLYVATRLGIQVCDQNGRVRAILTLPAPAGPIRSICFGGPHFDLLYATDGKQVFVRRVKVPGWAPWAAPSTVPSQGMG